MCEETDVLFFSVQRLLPRVLICSQACGGGISGNVVGMMRHGVVDGIMSCARGALLRCVEIQGRNPACLPPRHDTLIDMILLPSKPASPVHARY